ncbi:MAG: LUD domain-containing protein [Halobacteriota archaeon]
MTRATVSTFEQSLDRLEVGWTRTTVERLSTVLDDVCDRPAVGTPLSIPGAELPGWVDTVPTPAGLRAARTGITPAGIAIADYGSIVIQATPGGTEPVSLFPDRHVAVLGVDDVVPGMADAFSWFAEEFQSGRDTAIIATGPSATADMGALVRGAHGPKDVHVVLLEERASDE